MKPLQRVAAIHDLSGFGKCSLTVALPILSAAGIETCPLPTATLSTHTGGFEGFTFHDLTDDMEAYAQHWQSLDIHFAAIYSGFLGSARQVAVVEKIYDMFKTPDNLILMDPAMADNGKLYSVFDMDMVQNMVRLAAKADLLVPNMTEAALMLGEPYQELPYTKEYVYHIARGLSDLGPKQVVITGVTGDEAHLGAACYDRATDTMLWQLCDRVSGYFHGTGDVFASFLLAALLNGRDLSQATRLAVDLTQEAILRTVSRGTPRREGVDFEGVLPDLIKTLLPAGNPLP